MKFNNLVLTLKLMEKFGKKTIDKRKSPFPVGTLHRTLSWPEHKGRPDIDPIINKYD